ncbi:Uncharacterized protein APZ42_021623 [Daphnia magna]|uniref:Uncharacterized protein n=1 Tax=Daphnia magna TaxID=35525 RepID=A0A162CA09_9CRUS|nr:Uncharacterized protein APZ42_021623 [Daphnia magna]
MLPLLQPLISCGTSGYGALCRVLKSLCCLLAFLTTRFCKLSSCCWLKMIHI